MKITIELKVFSLLINGIKLNLIVGSHGSWNWQKVVGGGWGSKGHEILVISSNMTKPTEKSNQWGEFCSNGTKQSHRNSIHCLMDTSNHWSSRWSRCINIWRAIRSFYKYEADKTKAPNPSGEGLTSRAIHMGKNLVRARWVERRKEEGGGPS